MAESPAKRPRIAYTDEKVLIRLSDQFVRTDGHIICPMIKAEKSLRVLYKLQKCFFKDILDEVNRDTGLNSRAFIKEKSAIGGKIEGSVFIELAALQSIDEEKLSQYKDKLKLKLTIILKVEDILIDKVENTEETIPQPIISETDFDWYKLTLCYNKLIEKSQDTEERPDMYIAAENIKSQHEELTENYTKFAVLSQNGKGKSFFLNLLMLLTADNEKEYKEANLNLCLPQDIEENKTVGAVLEENTNLPAVVKDFIKPLNMEQNFRTIIDPVIKPFPKVTGIEDLKKSLSNVGSYFSKKKRISIKPYILPQKEIEGSYESTTKCIIYLRYGTVYQMSVSYFKAEELQEQLFDLVPLNTEDTMNQTFGDVNEDVNDRANECLKARLQVLTDHDISDDTEEIKKIFTTPKDIILSEEVKQFAGKTELYIGLGQNSTEDRLALQAVLRGLTTSQEEDVDKIEEYKKRIAAIKQIVVYLPSKILYGGKEILEMPGTDDSDPIAINFIKNALNEVDAVILMTSSSFKTAEKEVKDILFDSEFVKEWKKDPSYYKLMLLVYPEKNQSWQFGNSDQDKIKKLEQEEVKKRTEELKMISKIIKMEPLPEILEKNITTSYILPVLHTSIVAQKGKEYKIFEDNHDFLKYTGIEKFIIETDKYVSLRQQSSINEVKKQLSSFHQEINMGMNEEDAKIILHLLNNREFKKTREAEIYRNNEEKLVKLRKTIKKMLEDTVNDEVYQLLSENVDKTKIKWNKNQEKVKSAAVFNPFYSGKHPRFKACLFNLLFINLEDQTSQIFKRIRQRIEDILKEFKNKEIEDLNEHLTSMLGNKNSYSDFVTKSIENLLDDAISWYMGKKKRPFNEKILRKLFQESQNLSLKINILEPNFKQGSLQTVKEKIEEDIELCIMDVNNFFMEKILALHEDRWKSFYGKLVTKKSDYKLWKHLVTQIKLLCKDRNSQEHREVISKLLKMMSADLN